MIELTEDQRSSIERRYVLILAIGAAIAAALPALYALWAQPPGARYLGFEFGTDDQMVYAAWMRQAMNGQLLFDNRFTTDPQPGQTFHLFFLLLGQIARVTGIAVAMFLARVGFTALFVVLAHRLIRKLTSDIYTIKLALALTVLGGGLGFLMWNNFGRQVQSGDPIASALAPLTGGWSPVDVWQPEGFVFPSMLTNCLFMVSLCLILWIFLAFLEAREGWKPVLGGAFAMAALMNIHSYDVLLVTLVMVGFLTMQVVRRDAPPAWIARALAIGAGAVPPALWFVHVLQTDPVFQSRAATPTFSATFRQLVVGYLIMIVLGMVALARGRADRDEPGRAGVLCAGVMSFFLAGLCYLGPADGNVWYRGAAITLTIAGLACAVVVSRGRSGGESPNRASLLSVGILTLVISGLCVAGTGADPGAYFMSIAPWLVVYGIALIALGLVATANPAFNLVAAWAVVGLVAPYFPALFQRKLAMGLSVPWAILAAIGLAAIATQRERYSRNLTSVLAILLISATSARWLLSRERYLINNDVANTTTHPVYLGKDVRNILAYLNDLPGGQRTVVLAPIGQPAVVVADNQAVPDEFHSPYMPDLNPILSGLTGVYTYAGHWSETPNPQERQAETMRLYSSRTSTEERSALLEKIRPDYVVTPVPSSFPELPLQDLGDVGQVVVDGTKFRLIKVAR